MKTVLRAALALSLLSTPVRAAELSREEQSYIVVFLTSLSVADADTPLSKAHSPGLVIGLASIIKSAMPPGRDSMQQYSLTMTATYSSQR
jgi:hypothetical protein